MQRLYNLIDSHCHLHDEAFAADLDAVLERAREAGVTRIVTIGTSIAESKAALALAEKYVEVFATVGIAPHDTQPFTAETLAQLRELAQHPKVVALGEFGLDNHYNTWSRDEQQRIFREQLKLASELGKPVVIHNRDADEDTLALLREFAAQRRQSQVPSLATADTGHGTADVGLLGVMHCFSSTLALAQQCAALGFMVSIAGPITYPKPRALPDVARTLPLGALLVETDAPYLAPQRYRGKRNEPAYVREVAAQIAAMRGESLETVAQATTLNAQRLFGLA